MQHEEQAIQNILQEWAICTRMGVEDKILEHHRVDLVVYDVLPPLKYDSADAYRKSWDDWHLENQGAMIFEFVELSIKADTDLAFAYGIIRCGGVLEDGSDFENFVRATFALEKSEHRWKIVHQHLSMPLVGQS
ncbi:YybH family protein [Sessilibacter corallicola]|uniref:SnoaL-like domain-containing protein n=1 Tax=Sessilibacter corallicola TaxID=2904075 RepID=A0ABQ0AC07_9GAMM|nr:nuclear transport factor 2 family protein [Sessilibacter corallicola]MCE2027939.1 nuclear transport factor 2 family protein [Sessilibacter corallicola]